ncbi:hypothetical protein DFQ07_2134 [Tenacibaculum caenipelagi]|uniref:Uncharacterized protein n=1 Tax=Tenacibaculum caenipelagi TaxID=1325435 RepID=A0A4R6TGD5_9FLAO|nr:hypothetical protein DFQ07_2134 [Tenacibaculum caenipelagi]
MHYSYLGYSLKEELFASHLSLTITDEKSKELLF